MIFFQTHLNLYTEIELESDDIITDSVILDITVNNQCLKKLQMSYMQFQITEEECNDKMSLLKNAKCLHQLELADAPLSDFEFIASLKFVQILDLTSTKLNNLQIQHLKFLKELEYLYISFTSVGPSVSVQVVQTLHKLKVFDACGICFNFKHFKSILLFCCNLEYINVSFLSKTELLKARKLLETRENVKLSVFSFEEKQS